MSIKPIRPDEIQDKKNESIPEEVIQAVNELLIKNWNGSSATIKQKEIVDKYIELIKLPNEFENIRELKSRMFEMKWLDFEDVYRQLGWCVEYDKPAYNETYDAYFVFSKKKKEIKHLVI